MQKELLVTTGGYIAENDDKYTENVSVVTPEALLENLPQMLKCLTGDMVNQIEDPEHPLNGWQVTSIVIEPVECFEDDDGDENE